MSDFNNSLDKVLLGVATASLQIEGGDKNNSWYRWSIQPGKIEDGTNSLIANQHWEKYKEDIDLMKSLNIETYRMSLEWSRINPENGKFDINAINHYRDEITYLIKNNIKPLVTLHHFSNPLWIEDIGGWKNPETVKYFAKYVEWTVNNLKDLVSDWCTINEPNIYSIMGYIEGKWPPGNKKDYPGYFKASKNFIKAHLLSYEIIHKIRKEAGFNDTQVGFALHMSIFRPYNKNRLFDNLFAYFYDYVFHTIFIKGMAEGKFKFPIWSIFNKKKKIYIDFLGFNYYTRNFVDNKGKLVSAEKMGLPVNDLKWEIYPEGLYEIIKKYYKKYKMDIFITENGVSDKNDNFRKKYIYDHLKIVAKLVNEENIPVKRYYHWTFIDNFEWALGMSAKFGIVKLDYETQKREIRDSGKYYSRICKDKILYEYE